MSANLHDHPDVTLADPPLTPSKVTAESTANDEQLTLDGDGDPPLLGIPAAPSNSGLYAACASTALAQAHSLPGGSETASLLRSAGTRLLSFVLTDPDLPLVVCEVNRHVLLIDLPSLALSFEVSRECLSQSALRRLGSRGHPELAGLPAPSAARELREPRVARVAQPASPPECLGEEPA